MDEGQKNLQLMGSAGNYNRWIHRTISPYIGSDILEIGCGVGAMTGFFINKRLVVGTDISMKNIRKIRKRFGRRSNFSVFNHDISKGMGPLRRFTFDTVLCINVLEHIKDDIAALSNSGKLLSRKGRLVLFLPAFQLLYGSVDRADRHYRRYDRKSISKKLKKAGFSIEKMFFMNLPGFFGWYYHSRILKASLHPKRDISLFDRLVPVFSFFENIIRPPFGLSLVVVAKKNK